MRSCNNNLQVAIYISLACTSCFLQFKIYISLACTSCFLQFKIYKLLLTTLKTIIGNILILQFWLSIYICKDDPQLLKYYNPRVKLSLLLFYWLIIYWLHAVYKLIQCTTWNLYLHIMQLNKYMVYNLKWTLHWSLTRPLICYIFFTSCLAGHTG